MESRKHNVLLYSCNSSDLSLYCGNVNNVMKYSSIEITFLIFRYLFIECKITFKSVRSLIYDLRYLINPFLVSYKNDNKIFYPQYSFRHS